MYSLSHHGGDLALSDNFRLIEFACKDGSDVVLVHPALVELLEEIRSKTGSPIHINSAYRTASYNARIGGATHSRHVLGMAADIVARNVSLARLREVVNELNPGGIGTYSSFVHVDVWGENRRWSG